MTNPVSNVQPVNQSTKLALVPPTTPHLVTHKPTINLEAFPVKLRGRIEGWYTRLDSAIARFGQVGMEIGGILLEAQNELKERGVWTAFLNSLPGISAKTADRFIHQYRQSLRLPGPVREVAVGLGINFAGHDKRSPYGKYTRAVHLLEKAGTRMPRPSGNREEDYRAAREYLLVVTYRAGKLFRSSRDKSEAKDPALRAAETLVSLTLKQSPEQRGPFLYSVLREAIKRLGIKGLIRPVSEIPVELRSRGAGAA